jgi:hypothetical protein
VPKAPDFDQLKQQVQHLDRLIEEATHLRAEVEHQMNALRHSGDPERSGAPSPRMQSRRKR